MIPNKIYIGEHNTNVQTGYFSRNKDNVFTQEYIRKDALLEWAEEYLSLKIYDTKRDVMEDLIDKLNHF